MKHVGKMKNNSARVVVLYRTVPGEPNNCLIVGTQGLGDSYHDTLMTLIESDNGQQANELADILAVRKFPDGSVMLEYLHSRGHIKKVPTSNVLMTPNSQTQIVLSELNEIIAKNLGVTIDELAVTDGSQTAPKAKTAKKSEELSSTENKKSTLTPAEMRSRADALYKEAALLRKDADAIDPPKSTRKKGPALVIEE